MNGGYEVTVQQQSADSLAGWAEQLVMWLDSSFSVLESLSTDLIKDKTVLKISALENLNTTFVDL